MRLWTLHPKYLDPQGLVALWREALLAQKVLQGKTKGYKNHPQLIRFKEFSNPLKAIATYLSEVHQEALRRDYQFDKTKILKPRTKKKIIETDGQLQYEWKHLKRKLRQRNPSMYRQIVKEKIVQAHPLFQISPGDIKDWENKL